MQPNSTSSAKTASHSTFRRMQSPQLRGVLATVLGLAIPFAARAETKLVKVGNPVFDVTGGLVVIPAANARGSHEPWFAEIDRVLDEVRVGTHITLNNRCYDCPLKPHDGPYDQEILQGMVDVGYLITDAFTQGDDLAYPGTLLMPAVLTPNAAAPIGPSFENPSGPIIPNSIFPLSYRLEMFNSGRSVGSVSRSARALDRNVGPFRDRYGETNDLDFTGLNYSHLAFFSANARHSGGNPNSSQQRIGENKIVRTIRDANGNGWDVIEDYTIVAEATDIVGDLNYNGELEMGDLNIMTQNVAHMSDGHQVSEAQLRLDMNGDTAVDVSDVHHWVTDLKLTWIGDANLDGVFDSGDFVDVFGAGKYETGELARWSEGDWNSDERFDSGDFIAAFQDGG